MNVLANQHPFRAANQEIYRRVNPTIDFEKEKEIYDQKVKTGWRRKRQGYFPDTKSMGRATYMSNSRMSGQGSRMEPNVKEGLNGYIQNRMQEGGKQSKLSNKRNNSRLSNTHRNIETAPHGNSYKNRNSKTPTHYRTFVRG